jgi:hypothetical protein
MPLFDKFKRKESEKTGIQDNYEIIGKKVKDAIEWTPSHIVDKVSEISGKEEAAKNPLIVRKCCWECAFRNPNDTCENFQSPGKLPKRQPSEWISIPRQLSESMYCESWIDAQLAKLLVVNGLYPENITYRRRHPKIEIPPNGIDNFAKHLASQHRQEARSNKNIENNVRDIEWPIMDEGLKEILVSVEQNGNEKMWSQYQGKLLLMDPMPCINSILDCLDQKPTSQIAAFFRYVIHTHASFYYSWFSGAGEQGSKTYERILKLLNHQSNTIQEIGLELLNAVASNSYNSLGPKSKNSTDPNVWREWAKEDFRYSWGTKI